MRIKHILNTFKKLLDMRNYTKADLEELVSSQLENLNSIHNLLSIMKEQNELLNNVNKN